MKNLEFVMQICQLLEKNGQQPSVIEMTSGNYDDLAELIPAKIPTFTTDFCEVGAYAGVCYFVIILKSELFTKELFDMISGYPTSKIYGFKNFLKNYYPKENFSYENMMEQIKSEELTQIQFNFNTTKLTPELLQDNYLKIKSSFGKQKVSVENQLLEDFTASHWH